MAKRFQSQNDTSVQIRDPQRHLQTTADMTHLSYFEPSCDGNTFLPPIQAGPISHKPLQVLPMSSPSCKLNVQPYASAGLLPSRGNQLQVYGYTVKPRIEAACNTPGGQRMEPVVNNTSALLSGKMQSFVVVFIK